MKEKRGSRYPIWSAKTITIVSLVVMVLTAGLIFFLGHSSVLTELQYTLLAISASLFVFLSIGLYHGVRLKNDPIIKGNWEFVDKSQLIDNIGLVDLPSVDFGDAFSFADDLPGIILSVLLWIFVTIILLFVLIFLANLFWAVIFFLGIVIYWVFYRALRQAFIKARVCRGSIIQSLKYSFLYTVLYTSWIFGLIWASRILKTMF